MGVLRRMGAVTEIPGNASNLVLNTCIFYLRLDIGSVDIFYCKSWYAAT